MLARWERVSGGELEPSGCRESVVLVETQVWPKGGKTPTNEMRAGLPTPACAPEWQSSGGYDEAAAAQRQVGISRNQVQKAETQLISRVKPRRAVNISEELLSLLSGRGVLIIALWSAALF